MFDGAYCKKIEKEKVGKESWIEGLCMSGEGLGQ
uniref:Uncharacterized protein n=1 Tax=Anguilla anguilla TaxID=7936 RepID=A0A0E9PDL6_ANGAN